VRLLLDTHALVWWMEGNRRLSPRVRGFIADRANEILVSAASAWEICTKARLGKLPGAAALASDVAQHVAEQGFSTLPISLLHAQRAGGLPGPHRDPFDRILIAQSQIEVVPIASIDGVFERYGLSVLW
jgi:PIN domain nuclease of toxin-antitoxin system